MSKELNVLLVEPNRYPRAVTIDSGLESLQKMVGGYIEAVYPYEDPVAIIVNDEGKLNGMPLNRALRDEEGVEYDVLAGNFLVVGLEDSTFCSLTPEQFATYEEMFHQPETFISINGSLMILKTPDRYVDNGESKQAEAEIEDELEL